MQVVKVQHGIGTWNEEFGNHRVCVQVSESANAVWLHIPWRRRDHSPESNDILIFNAVTTKQVKNMARVEVNREYCDIVFQPDQAPGEYYVYYMPYTASKETWKYSCKYSPPKSLADPAWIQRNWLTPEKLSEKKWKALSKAKVLEIQARSERDRFDPMEIIATEEETEKFLIQHRNRSYLLFPEDRKYPIRMIDDLPLGWIRKGPSTEFHGEAKRGEFYTFQIGVYSATKSIEDITINFSDMRSDQGKVIPADAFCCFNLSGTDWLGKTIKKRFAVDKSKVRALWFGVQIPKDAAAGNYQGKVTLHPKDAEVTIMKLSLAISAEVIEECGDSELCHHSRLRWLNSTIGLDEEVVTPYTPLKIKTQTVQCLGRQVHFANTGLPDSISSSDHEILAKPVAMVVETTNGEISWAGAKAKIVKSARGTVTWESHSRNGPLRMRCRAKMEFDGYINFCITLKAEKPTEIKDIRLEIPLRREIATYMMGIGHKGGYRSKEWRWAWDKKRANNSFWIGEVGAGLYCKLKGPEDTWELSSLEASGIPETWNNNGRGSCTVTEDGDDTVLVCAYSGKRSLKSGKELKFCFGLLITPVKPLDSASHWDHRYYQETTLKTPSLDNALKSGATIINVHHGNPLNPYINYPFLTVDKLTAYVKKAHQRDLKVKIYYTVRELTNRVVEMWALRSLGNEVFVDGYGGGHPWLCEHLVSNYSPAWHQILLNGEVDAAIHTAGLSRWHNYYLEGLRWLIKNVEIDGLYLDGIGYDREIMKRVRKVMDRERSGCLIDFHSGNNFTYQDQRISAACQYMEHFPYIDSLWFGEMYDYDEPPDYWLVEISGIPFGLFGEMLQGGGNPWRGMLYGMTNRLGWCGDPTSIWNIWDNFGIKDAQMIGYWEPSCPIKTNHKDILATAYCKKDKLLVSIASWAKESVRCQLRIDWKAVGLNPQKAQLSAPAISGFQHQALFHMSDDIPVEPGRGWLLIAESR